MNTPLPYPGGWRAAAGIVSLVLLTLVGLAFIASHHFHEAVRWGRVGTITVAAIALMWLAHRPVRAR